MRGSESRKPVHLPRLRQAEQAGPVFPDRDCMAPVPIRDRRLAPALMPGDQLVPVTCKIRRPRFGEFVVIEVDPTSPMQVHRYIGPVGAGSHRVWDGTAYGLVPERRLRGRILTVVRDGKPFDLSVAAGWPGRDRLAGWAHSILAFLRRRLHAARSAQGAPIPPAR